MRINLDTLDAVAISSPARADYKGVIVDADKQVTHYILQITSKEGPTASLREQFGGHVDILSYQGEGRYFHTISCPPQPLEEFLNNTDNRQSFSTKVWDELTHYQKSNLNLPHL